MDNIIVIEKEKEKEKELLEQITTLQLNLHTAILENKNLRDERDYLLNTKIYLSLKVEDLLDYIESLEKKVVELENTL